MDLNAKGRIPENLVWRFLDVAARIRINKDVVNGKLELDGSPRETRILLLEMPHTVNRVMVKATSFEYMKATSA